MRKGAGHLCIEILNNQVGKDEPTKSQSSAMNCAAVRQERRLTFVSSSFLICKLVVAKVCCGAGSLWASNESGCFLHCQEDIRIKKQ